MVITVNMDYSPLAQFYDLHYRHYTDDLEFYTRLGEDYGGPVLELGAGTGRVSRAIARKGLEVVALEPSAAMRKLGKKNTRGLGVQWQQGDMRSLELLAVEGHKGKKLGLNRKFPLIIAPFNAFMHLYTPDDQDRAMRGIVDRLEARGRLAFDLYNPALIGPEGVVQFEGEYEDLQVFVHQSHQKAIQALTTHYLVDSIGAKGELKRQTYTLTQRYFTRYEAERWLRAFGLDFRLFGGFQKQPFAAESPHLVFTAWTG